jgi:hypothetical protein
MSEDDWYLMDDNPYLGVRRWGLDTDTHTIIRTEYYQATAFMEANLAERNESIGKRFKNFQHVASIPMHIWAREIAPRQKQQDQASIKRWLNDSDNVAFRTFRGKV